MNDKVKSLFFSQYLEQKVFQTFGIVEVLEPKMLTVQNGYLLLRDISQLTENEALMLCKMQMTDEVLKTMEIKRFYKYENKTWCLQYKFINGLRQDVLGQPGYMHSEVALFDGGDYTYASNEQFKIMQAIGILTPFTYLSETNQPITLTPTEIINLGWAKLQSNEQ